MARTTHKLATIECNDGKSVRRVFRVWLEADAGTESHILLTFFALSAFNTLRERRKQRAGPTQAACECDTSTHLQSTHTHTTIEHICIYIETKARSTFTCAAREIIIYQTNSGHFELIFNK